MRSIHTGPSSSMKKVRNVIVTIATTSEITLFVIEIAVPVSPSTFDAPPFVDRVPDLLDDVVLRLEEAEPAAALRQVVDVARERAWTKSLTWLTSVGMKSEADPDDRDERERRR